MKKFVTEVILVPDHIQPPEIFSEGAIVIRVCDDAAGRYLKISTNDGEVPRVDFSELDALYAACKELENQ